MVPLISGEGKFFTLTSFDGTCDEVREQWLERRRDGIGGSDVAAIMGLSPYSSPYKVFAEKVLGVSDDISDVPAVYWGNRLEALIGEEYQTNHPDRMVRRVNGIASSIGRPWAQASLDFEVKDPDLGWGVLEIKTAGDRRQHDWDGGVPVYYQTQVTHYLSVTGRAFADVAVLIGGRDYREYRIMRDEDDIKAVEEAVDAFWRDHVLAQEPPEAGGIDGKAVFESHSEAADGLLESESVPKEVLAWRAAKTRSDEADAALKEATAKLKELIGGNSGIKCPLGEVKWLRNERTSFDSKRFRKENEEMFARYATTKRVDGGLRFKENKEVL